MAVGQIAKIKGCRVVGIAGGARKCAYAVEELGFDAAIDYKSEDVARSLRRACGDGIDVYFDNVGGDTLDACLAQLRLGARVVVCGAISQYNATTAVRGPRNYLSLLVNRATMQGMVVFDFAKRYPQAVAEIARWLASGRFISREDVRTAAWKRSRKRCSNCSMARISANSFLKSRIDTGAWPKIIRRRAVRIARGPRMARASAVRDRLGRRATP